MAAVLARGSEAGHELERDRRRWREQWRAACVAVKRPVHGVRVDVAEAEVLDTRALVVGALVLLAFLVVVLVHGPAYARGTKARAPLGLPSDGAHDQRGTSSMASKKTSPRVARRKTKQAVDRRAVSLAKQLRSQIELALVDDELLALADDLIRHLEAPEVAEAIGALRGAVSKGLPRRDDGAEVRARSTLASLLSDERTLSDEHGSGVRLARYALHRMLPRAARPGEEETRSAALALLDRYRQNGADTSALAAGHVLAAVHLILSEARPNESECLKQMHQLARTELRALGPSELFVPVEDALGRPAIQSLVGPFNSLVPDAKALLAEPRYPAWTELAAFAFVSELHARVPGLRSRETDLAEVERIMSQATYLRERVLSLRAGERTGQSDAEELVAEMIERALRDAGTAKDEIRRRMQFLRKKSKV